MSTLVKASVIIPTYNRGRFVREAVDSVLNQTFNDYEIVVVDDGSVDDTKEVLASYGNRIRYIYQTNSGVSAARNRGILSSNGEYVAFLDDDDLWLPRKLELQIKYLDEHPEVGLLFSNTNTATTGEDLRFANKKMSQISKPHRGKVFRELFVENFIPCCSVVVRRICFDKVGLFDPSLRNAQDYDMWLRIARFFRVDYIDQPLAIYRHHVHSLSHGVEKEIESEILLRKKMISLDPSLLVQFSHQTIKEAYYRSHVHLGWVQMWKGDLKKARKNYWQYIQLDPLDPRVYVLVMITILPFRLISKFGGLARHFTHL
jgi:glycosyltransferase involved in cell wall biosynthesis